MRILKLAATVAALTAVLSARAAAADCDERCESVYGALHGYREGALRDLARLAFRGSGLSDEELAGLVAAKFNVQILAGGIVITATKEAHPGLGAPRAEPRVEVYSLDVTKEALVKNGFQNGVSDGLRRGKHFPVVYSVKLRSALSYGDESLRARIDRESSFDDDDVRVALEDFSRQYANEYRLAKARATIESLSAPKIP